MLGWCQEGHSAIKLSTKVLCYLMQRQFYRHGFLLWVPRTIGANSTTGKEMSVSVSKGDLMTDPGKTFRETRIPDATSRKLKQTLRFATANVGSLTGRSAEVVDMLYRRKVDVAGLQEVRYKNHGTRTVKRGEETYKLFWSGNSTVHGGVGVMVTLNLVKHVVEFRQVNASRGNCNWKRSGYIFVCICSSLWL